MLLQSIISINLRNTLRLQPLMMAKYCVTNNIMFQDWEKWFLITSHSPLSPRAAGSERRSWLCFPESLELSPDTNTWVGETNLILLSKWHSLLSTDFEEAFSEFLIISISVTANTFNVDIFVAKRIKFFLSVPWLPRKMFKSFIFQERCINAGTLTVNFEKVPVDYKLKHNDLLANIVHRYKNFDNI